MIPTKREPLPKLFDDNLSRREIKHLKRSWEKNLVSDSNYPTIEPFAKIISSEVFWRQVKDIIIDEHPYFERVLPPIKHKTVIFSGIFKTCMANLDDLHNLDEFLMNVGRKHLRVFGIDSNYFKIMGLAFMKAIEIFCYPCNDHWKIIEISKLWGKIFSFLANSMIIHGEDDEIMIINSEKNESNSAFIISNSTIGGSEDSNVVLKKKIINNNKTNNTVKHQPSLQSILRKEKDRVTNALQNSSSVRSGGSSHPDLKAWAEMNTSVSPFTPPTFQRERSSGSNSTLSSSPSSSSSSASSTISSSPSKLSSKSSKSSNELSPTPTSSTNFTSGEKEKEIIKESSRSKFSRFHFGSSRTGNGNIDAKTLIEINNKAAEKRAKEELKQQKYLAKQFSAQQQYTNRKKAELASKSLQTPPSTPPKLDLENSNNAPSSGKKRINSILSAALQAPPFPI